MAEYRPRVADRRLEKLLRAFGAVEIVGPKWCGKTWTALAHASSVDRLDDSATYDAASNDPNLVLMGEEPHLVDEWQEVPAVWDAARRHVDDNANRKGQLILTGSSQPKETEKIHHSGTGRIARLHMRPMSLAESGESTGSVSLGKLFEGEFEPSRNKTGIMDVARWCCRGGWPSNLDVEDEFALETSAEYVRSILDVNIPKLGLNPEIMRVLMKALAMNVAQAPTSETLMKDMSYGDEGVSISAPTLKRYVDELKSLYLIDDLEGWEPSLRAKSRVRTKPKRYFVDPSLPSALLGATPAVLARDTQTLGDLFETLVIRDLRVYLESMGGTNRIAYYRDEKGLEVDVILELVDGRWAAVGIKLSDLKVMEKNVDKLHAFKEKVCGNPLSQVREPEFMAFIVGRGDIAYRRDDGILVLPIATLGA